MATLNKTKKKAAKSMTEEFITLPSMMNYAEEDMASELSESMQYPDFFDDVDNMNRYLW